MSYKRTFRNLAVGLLSAAAIAAPATAQESAGPAAGDIDIWVMGAEGEKFPALASAFEQANPEAKINLTVIPWSDYATKLETALATGSTPDLTMLGASDVANFVASGGLDAVPEGLVDNSGFFAGALENSTVKGTQYAVPWYVETRVLFYRKDLAEAAGVTPPKTWEEFVPFAEALKAQGTDWATVVPTGASGTWHGVIPYVWQAGGNVVNGEGTEYSFNTPEVLAGFEQYRSLVANGVAMPSAPIAPGEIEALFVTGKVASFVGGPWMIGVLNDVGGDGFVDEKVGLTLLPTGPAGSASVVGGGSWAVFAAADNKDGAWKLAKWLSETANQQTWFDIMGDLPAIQAAWQSDALSSDPHVAVFGEQLKSAKAAPPLSTWTQVSDVINREVERMTQGGQSAEQTIEAIQSQAARIGTGD